MNFEVFILGHKHKMPAEYKPPPEYKPPKKGLQMFTSSGLIFGFLRYNHDETKKYILQCITYLIELLSKFRK